MALAISPIEKVISRVYLLCSLKQVLGDSHPFDLPGLKLSDYSFVFFCSVLWLPPYFINDKISLLYLTLGTKKMEAPRIRKNESRY